MPAGLTWTLAAVVLLAVVILLRQFLGRLLRFLGRMAAGLAGLFVFGQVGGVIGVTLGVNLVNALVVALLGLPGFGLLLLLHWMLQV